MIDILKLVTFKSLMIIKIQLKLRLPQVPVKITCFKVGTGTKTGQKNRVRALANSDPNLDSTEPKVKNSELKQMLFF